VVGGVGFVFLAWLLVSIGHRKLLRVEVNQYGMFAVVGAFGRGKTYLATWLAYYLLHPDQSRQTRKWQPRRVFSNMPALKGQTECVSTWADVVRICRQYGYHQWTNPDGGFLLVLDEAHTWWDSAEVSRPVEIAEIVSQLRKLKVTVILTTQDWSFLPERLRKLCSGVWLAERSVKPGWHTYTSYDTPRGRVIPLAAKKMGRIRVKRQACVMEAYDTTEFVRGSALSALGEAHAVRQTERPDPKDRGARRAPAGRGRPIPKIVPRPVPEAV